MRIYHYHYHPINQTIHSNNSSGLYHEAYEHDSCGVGFITHIKNQKSRKIIDQGLKIMCNIEHRGAIGADPETGDGAGILIQMPHEFIQDITQELKISLPKPGFYGVGMHFFPQDVSYRNAIENIIEKIITDEDQVFLGWRDVPVDPQVIGVGAKEMMPFIKQSFIGANANIKNQDEFEVKLFMIRRMIDHRIRIELKLDRSTFYVPSFSSRTLVYKGMLTANQLPKFYLDIQSPKMKSALALVHTRFSTNTFPSWDLAHPFRLIAHNGEINTLRGNMNWMAAREKVMSSPLFGKELKRMLPILMNGQSDSAAFDSVFELLVLSGRSLPHAIMMMIPEAWSKHKTMDEDLKAFYEYHATMMEPWDGPAAVVFTDGKMIGGTLDRNGLRPARYTITKDDIVVLASEVGVLDIKPEDVKQHGRLQPGKMFLVDLEKQTIIPDEEIKKQISTQTSYKKWISQMFHIDELPEPSQLSKTPHNNILEKQHLFGYTREDIVSQIIPLVETGKEPTGSMGTDVALAVLSEKPQLLFRYFKQLFAQVTNPPIDAIREELVMELTTYLGAESNLLDETSQHAHRIELSHPVITNEQLERIREISHQHFKSSTVDTVFNPHIKHGLRDALEDLYEKIKKLVLENTTLIILSDRTVSPSSAPIPSLLCIGAVHHYLIRQGLRTKTSLILETGEPREVPHFALLCGYGANAVNPYLAFETINDLYENNFLENINTIKAAYKNYFKSIEFGLYKIFSKMGISTLQSYCGAQIFEAVGLDSEVIERYFTGTASQIEGVSLEMIEKEAVYRHRNVYNTSSFYNTLLPTGGIHYYRYQSENHLWHPESIAKLQISTKTNDASVYKEYSALINNQEGKNVTLRSLLDFNYIDKPLSLDEVEPASEIVKRFATGAMSFGSISWEAHTSLAIAMNHIGGKSNTGEGGEDPIRFKVTKDGVNMRSAIKQVASGRFGVTAEYLVNADELQIKMAQGAKPGEGGQLPGFKVDKIIAKTRYSTPGVTLISPPPHHDIYSIEDLQQLIFDLKNINPKARVSVKLVSEVGVGTIAAGVAKAKADHILISGHDGGTGASPISSIQYAGTPWELGLAETQQTLVLNGLRDRIWVQVDGQMKTGRDVVLGALLGADEFGFSTAPLVTQGCIMMRKCHLNTCPVGIATQDPSLREKFSGLPEYLINYLFFVAEEVREYMAKLGFKTMNEMIGQVDKIHQVKPRKHWKARGLDLSKVLTKPVPRFNTGIYRTKSQDHGLDKQLDNELIQKVRTALESQTPIEVNMSIRNVNRTFGAMLSHEVAKLYGNTGLPDTTIKINMLGNAGQSFGAFTSKGVEITLTGCSNDYTGKGLSGGRLIVKTPEGVSYESAENIIIGNTSFYGATSGEAYINGRAGERFCVRNSGVNAVVEGVGDHGCEYMTGGIVVILGHMSRNFAAGMSGGYAYFWDVQNILDTYLNKEMVEVETQLDTDSLEQVYHMIQKHKDYTQSDRAKYILNHWENEKYHFKKIIPIEYKLALKKQTKDLKTWVK